MIPLIPDGLCAEMVLILVLESEAADVLFPEQQLLQPLGNQLVPTLEPVVGRIVENSFLHVDIEGQVFLGDVGSTELHTFLIIVYDAHIFIYHRFVWHGVLDEIPGNEFPDVALAFDWDQHQGFLFGIREQHITNDIVPVVMPCSGFLHRLLTCTFP